jgi:hypothetical protein
MRKCPWVSLVVFLVSLLIFSPQFASFSKGESTCSSSKADSGAQGDNKSGSGAGLGLGVSVDLSNVFGKNKTQEEDPFKAPPKKTTTSTMVDIKDEKDKPCHCQGGRLIIIIGNFKDPSIARSREWVKTLALGSMKDTHLHIVAFDAPSGDPNFDYPYVVDEKAKDGWRKLTHVVRDVNKNQIIPPCCCFYEEVIIMFHGDSGRWSKLIDYLPVILNKKPVEKVLLWACKSSEAFFPKSGRDSSRDIYEKICLILQPKRCPCKCDPVKCRAYSADGKKKIRKCPLGDKPTVILTAGEFQGKATTLQMKCNSFDNPLTSPDGKLREIQVSADGKITASLTGTGQKVFGDVTVGVTSSLDCPGKFKIETGEIFDPNKHLADSFVYVYKKPPKKEELPYFGPLAEGCIDKAGCIKEEEKITH